MGRVNFTRLAFSENWVRKPSLLVVLFSVCFAFWFLDFWKPYNTAKYETNFHSDIFNYYSYLPAIFCNNGSFDWNDVATNYNPFGPLNTHLPKTTYGMSIMYAPFFALGYKIAYNQGSPLNGFSEPFATCIRWGSIFYVMLGMLFLRRFLLFFFNEVVTSLTLVCVLFGTMLFAYTFVQSELTHGYLFCLFSIFLYLTYKWHQAYEFKYTLWLAFITAIISLIRPTEIFIFLFFIFWNVKSFADLKAKFRLMLQKYLHFVVIFLAGVVMWIPQFMFWKHHTGQYFYDSYPGERFFFNDPQIINILFSYRKGWILYTPLVLLSFIGFFFVKKDFPLSKWTFIIITAMMVYLLSCWWDWFFGGCFGARGFCQMIAYLAIPMAFFIEFVLYSEKKFLLKGWLALVVMVYVFSCICHNIGQTYLSKTGRIHSWAMSKKVYWDVFRTYQWDDEYQHRFWGDINIPDYSKLKSGEDRDQ